MPTNGQTMNIKKACKTFTHALARIWKAIFCLFSAVMLYAFIAVCIHIIMDAMGTSGEAIDAALVVFTCLAAIYAIGKSYHVIFRWMRNRRHPLLDDKDNQR